MQHKTKYKSKRQKSHPQSFLRKKKISKNKKKVKRGIVSYIFAKLLIIQKEIENEK